MTRVSGTVGQRMGAIFEAAHQWRACLACRRLFAGTGSRCPGCLAAWRRQYDAHRPAHHKLYSTAAWRKLSAEVRGSATRCHWCAKVTRRLVADHVQPLAHRPDLALDPTNVVAACVGCNTRRGRNLR